MADLVVSAKKTGEQVMNSAKGLAGFGIEAGGNIISSLIGAHSAGQQMKFQERMSNTAHQREVKDLIAAGINPIMSGLGGSGASQPMGTMIHPDNPVRGLGQNVLQQMLNKHQMVMMDAQAEAAYGTADQASAAAAREAATAENIKADTLLKRLEVNEASAASSMYKDAGKWAKWLQFIKSIIK